MTAPVLTIIGEENITIDIDTDYIDQGATATDDYDGNLTSKIETTSTVSTAITGNYSVTYTVKDRTGNEATKTRTVTVVEPTADTTKPTITLTGEANFGISQDTTYTDEGATASDNIDGDITSSIVIVSNVDTATIGSYTVTYNAQDAAGNSATEVIRNVTVVEQIDPTALDVTFAVDATWADIETELDSLTTSFDPAVNSSINLQIPVALTNNISMDYSILYPTNQTHDISTMNAIYDARDALQSIQNKLNTIKSNHPTISTKVTTSGSLNLDISYDLTTLNPQSNADIVEMDGYIASTETTITEFMNGTATLEFTRNGNWVDEALVNPNIDNANAGITIADINEFIAAGQGWRNVDNLYISNPGPISGTFTMAEMEVLRKVCFDNASVYAETAPAFINTDNAIVNVEGTELNQTTIDDFFANNIGYNQSTEITLSNGTWNGDFCASPLNAVTNTNKFTPNNLNGKINFADNMEITALTVKLNNDDVENVDTFSVNSSSMGELTDILYNKIKLDHTNKANITLDLGSMATNILDNFVNSDGTGKIQLHELNLGTTTIAVRFEAGTNTDINASIINGWLTAAASDTNIGFYSDMMTGVNVLGDETLNIDAANKTIDNVTFNGFVTGDFTSAKLYGRNTFNAGTNANLSSALISTTDDKLILKGDVAGTNINSISVDGHLDTLGVTNGTLDGIVNRMNILHNADYSIFTDEASNTPKVTTLLGTPVI